MTVETPKPKPTRAKRAATPDPKRQIHPLARPFLFLDSKLGRTLPFWIFLVLLAATLVGEYFHHFHAEFEYQFFGFYAAMGFFGFCLAVLMGWPLRALLGRDEDYYEKGARDE